MRVYVPINGNKHFTDLASRFPDRLGHIISPSYYLRPKPGIRFILDNDAFGCWTKGVPFNEVAWMKMVDKINSEGCTPEWAIIPDVVCDKNGTLEAWNKYCAVLPHWRKAFVLQDGITLEEVPQADLYFVGGSTEFKWSTAHYWCDNLERVHVGRVRARRLHYCERIGAESCDGSGWLRETVRGRPFKQLEAWVMECNHQHELNLTT